MVKELEGDVLSAEQDVADLAENLRDVAEAFRAALRAGLTRRAVVVLIKDLNRDLHVKQIEGTLEALFRLDDYLDGG